ncbi:MAG: hypothetical protein J6I61_09525 [Prevotella sp.]|nr:hypothetical protein [Prevotella sp.]
MTEEFNHYLRLAGTHLANKPRDNYYDAQGIYSPYSDYTHMLVALTDEQVRHIRALKACYGSDFVDHLADELFHGDDDAVSDLFYGDPDDIDTEHVYHQYRFTIHEVGADGSVTSHAKLLHLSDADYTKLLALQLYDEHLTINTLYYYDPSLQRTILNDAMFYFMDEEVCILHAPFTITMDEVLADADQLVSQYRIPRNGAYLELPKEIISRSSICHPINPTPAKPYHFQVMVALTYDDKDIDVAVALTDNEVNEIKQLIADYPESASQSVTEYDFVQEISLLQILEEGSPRLFEKFWRAIMPPVFVETLIDGLKNDCLEEYDDDHFADYHQADFADLYHMYGDDINLEHSSCCICRIPKEWNLK